MSDSNQDKSDESSDEKIARELVLESSLIPDIILEILVGNMSIKELLSQTEYNEDTLSSLESTLLRGSATLSIELPPDYRYLPITRLYVTILEKDGEISKEIRKGVKMVKDDVDFHHFPPEKKGEFGKIISEVKDALGTRFVAEKSSDDLLLLLTLVSEVLERETALLFKSNVISSEYRESQETDSLINGFSQDEIEGLLLRTGVIPEGIYSELQHIRNTRNTMVHSINERLTLEQTARALSEAHRAVNVLNDIVEMNEGVRPINTRG